MKKVECKGRWVRCPDEDCGTHRVGMYLDCGGCYGQYQRLRRALERRAMETVRIINKNAGKGEGR